VTIFWYEYQKYLPAENRQRDMAGVSLIHLCNNDGAHVAEKLIVAA